ncbi:MAG: UTP--glucose-1-phosphate uridylyltransferase GalU [Chloroflexi bacterium]|nr:UTP--glucose-1-phosphate uridylyltransferase GalU [Chloroflexota bacterium]
MKVRKAVITAAGWGTRFLPVTKAQPKEMLPLVDKPIIQYAVEEAVTAGLKQVVMVTAQGKRAIEDYFDRSFELEYLLQQRGETALWEQVRRLSNMADIAYVRQKEQLGLGNAVLVTQAVVGEEPFALFLPDDVFVGNGPVIGQLIEAYGELGGCVLAVERVKKEEVGRYGIIAPKQIGPRLYQVLDLVEKPSPQQAPSDLAIVGRYVLEPKIFAALEATPPGRGQEIQLTDGLRRLLPREKIYAVEYEGVRYDAGTPMSWLKATVALALDHPELGAELRDYLRNLI